MSISLKDKFAFQNLEKHFQEVKKNHLRELFEKDPNRAVSFSLTVGDIFLDYSKNRIIEETLKLLIQLAEESGLRKKIS